MKKISLISLGLLMLIGCDKVDNTRPTGESTTIIQPGAGNATADDDAEIKALQAQVNTLIEEQKKLGTQVTQLSEEVKEQADALKAFIKKIDKEFEQDQDWINLKITLKINVIENSYFFGNKDLIKKLFEECSKFEKTKSKSKK